MERRRIELKRGGEMFMLSKIRWILIYFLVNEETRTKEFHIYFERRGCYLSGGKPYKKEGRINRWMKGKWICLSIGLARWVMIFWLTF